MSPLHEAMAIYSKICYQLNKKNVRKSSKTNIYACCFLLYILLYIFLIEWIAINALTIAISTEYTMLYHTIRSSILLIFD